MPLLYIHLVNSGCVIFLILVLAVSTADSNYFDFVFPCLGLLTSILFLIYRDIVLSLVSGLACRRAEFREPDSCWRKKQIQILVASEASVDFLGFLILLGKPAIFFLITFRWQSELIFARGVSST